MIEIQNWISKTNIRMGCGDKLVGRVDYLCVCVCVCVWTVLRTVFTHSPLPFFESCHQLWNSKQGHHSQVSSVHLFCSHPFFHDFVGWFDTVEVIHFLQFLLIGEKNFIWQRIRWNKIKYDSFFARVCFVALFRCCYCWRGTFPSLLLTVSPFVMHTRHILVNWINFFSCFC
jgi:hypothetical protein